MVFGKLFKRREHPLPKFPDTVIPAFKNLCQEVPVEEVSALKPEVNQCLEKFEEVARKNRTINIDLARDIANRCNYLLDHYAEYEAQQRAFIMGAVRYFAIAEDPFSEETFATGFDDDARVINHVLEELGLTDMYIEIR